MAIIEYSEGKEGCKAVLKYSRIKNNYEVKNNG